MKLSLIIGLGLMTSLIACKKDEAPPRDNIAAFDKVVSFNLQQAKDYSEPIYNGVRAEVGMAIQKVNKRTGAATLVWDTTVSYQSIRDYPAMGAPLLISKTLPGVKDAYEFVEAGYWIRYKTAADQISMKATNEFAPLGTGTVLLEVNL